MRFKPLLILCLLLLILPVSSALAAKAPVKFLTGPNDGEAYDIAIDYLNQHLEDLGLSQEDVADYEITDLYRTKHNGTTHIYLRQRHAGIPVYNGAININIAADGSVINLGNLFVPNLAGKVNSTSPAMAPEAAILAAADNLGMAGTNDLIMLENKGGPTTEMIFSGAGLSEDDIPVGLMYQPQEDGTVRLAWNVVINRVDNSDWWDMRVDAYSGEVISKTNWTNNENVGGPSYLAIPLPAESPDDSGQVVINNPEDATASPFGWHDTDGTAGAEFTDTRGNNVFAQDDLDANNSGGSRPSGGASLNFNEVWDPGAEPIDGNNVDASVVNLFYYNNIMHDVTYQYGFDEASGNFQENNYGNGGAASDPVNADALDGSGTNNANFSTPADGFNPRMQMFRWLAPPVVGINAPPAIAGDKDAAAASFGATYTLVGVTDDMEWVDDGDDEGGAGSVHDGCQAFTPGDLNGKVALIDRGGCEFGIKALNAENAGATAAVVVNNGTTAAGTCADPNCTLTMGPGVNGGSVTIATAMIGMVDGDDIKTQIGLPATVNATVYKTEADRDSDFDNGIIAHEYGHGISNRLTGGPGSSGCLNGTEQAGEGWSDFWALVLSAVPADTANQARGIGNYVIFEPTSGPGIRNFPYSTDMGVNPQTYEDIGTTNAPHGVGEIWMSMVWEVYWNLVDKHGFDADFYNGTGGNNLMIQLIIDGMKLQGCSPTFVSARDAILLADQNNNGGANQCEIWTGFAKRGLGVSAVAGTTAAGDETEAFDYPGLCGESVFADGFESGDTTAWSAAQP